jgi:hypothetical protein
VIATVPHRRRRRLRGSFSSRTRIDACAFALVLECPTVFVRPPGSFLTIAHFEPRLLTL